MPQRATTGSPLQTLPVPVTANGDVYRSGGWIGAGRGAVSFSFSHRRDQYQVDHFQ